MTGIGEMLAVALVGLGTTSSSMAGAAIGLYLPISKRLLACILAFAAGALISALAIDLGYGGAVELRHANFSSRSAWGFVGGGFAIGAIVYYLASLYLEKRGAAVRFPTRFEEYALGQKRKNSRALIKLLSTCDLLRHLPAEGIEGILRTVKTVRLPAGEELFHVGDPGDALFIVADGSVEITSETGSPLASLGAGQAFGEMALLSGGLRTATVRAKGATDLLRIDRDDFEDMIEADHQLASAAQRLSHERAIKNLATGGPNPGRWARVARSNLHNLSRGEVAKLLTKTGDGAGMAIIFGNILDTIPGCLVIGAKFHGFASLSLTLMLGMFFGGIPEAAASAAILARAGYKPRKIFGLWSTVLVAGLLAAVAGKLFIGNPHSLAAVFCQAIAGGAVLALVAHAMIPEAIHEGGSLVVLPTVAGFLFALYLSLAETVT
ncbi:cyclic nucleotide-binding domain-containing protein [Lichenifustis flavocetrariae]|uniref:Cyclic nucleotide-binding domain-containing protein n=1 Tax=Lichenifustis flavocetrariae TaxID=2949735 RepID=A0AA41Z8C0_9HYPH|nr:cyclic nucleotide-binding domain-containing protein [Lichenifustis flavocetrariae]MCW6512205.1 cyclic nucleotide-binding domain-containing protein [Lichenifustis flavocetrariae]